MSKMKLVQTEAKNGAKVIEIVLPPELERVLIPPPPITQWEPPQPPLVGAIQGQARMIADLAEHVISVLAECNITTASQVLDVVYAHLIQIGAQFGYSVGGKR